MVLKYIKEYQLESWISDLSSQHPVGAKDLEWFEAFVVPHGFRLGIKCMSFIAGAKRQVERLQYVRPESIGKPVPIKYFNSRQEALSWCGKQMPLVNLALEN